jgi:RimJ/RimL family protein N-acetyltransferase
MKTLHTPRLLLRPFTMGDLHETHRLLYADPQVAPAWTARTKSLDEIQFTFAAKVAQQENDFGFLAVVLKAGSQLIGTVALQRYLPGDDTHYMRLENAPDYRVGSDPARIEVELTYALGRAYWRQGFASEAGRALIAHGFKEMAVWRIINSVNGQNLTSVNLMRRLGFRLERNLYRSPFGHLDAAGIIGILDSAEA